MISAPLQRMALSFGLALALHGGLYVAGCGSDGPAILIGGQSISVHVTMSGNAHVDSAASQQQEKQVAGPSGEAPQPRDDAPQTQPPADVPQPVEAHPPAKPEAVVAKPEHTVPPAAETSPAEKPLPPKDKPAMEKPTPTEQTAAADMAAKPVSAPAREAAKSQPTETPPAPSAEQPPVKQDTTKPDSRTEAGTSTAKADDGGKNAESKVESAASAASVAGSPSASEGKEAASPGNAAASNYAGKVMEHLSRFRRPRPAGPGSAYVSFPFTDAGDIDSIEISKTSGSHRFDRDAIAFIRRAAPFPAPPKGVSRAFTVKIEGR
jgi:protein TonB